MQEKWNYLDSGIHDAAINMAIDESLLNWHSKGLIPPVLRLYGWKLPSLSIGQFQKAEKTINFDGIDKHGCEFVRRLTGGSAVLHDDELTYSLIVSENHPNIPQSVQKAYYVLSKGVLEGYRNLGINADYAVPEREALRDKTAVCFEKTAVYEMIVDGKKISGNAQTRKDGVLLQHGSIPMTMDEEMLFDLFKFKSERARERQRENFSNKAVSIEQITQKPHTYDMLKNAFLEGFKKGLDIDVEPMELSAAQWTEVNELADSKYRNDEWNLRRLKERVPHG